MGYVTREQNYVSCLKSSTDFYSKRLAPWDRVKPSGGETGVQDIRTDHPRDTGTSVWDTALFDIDKFEASE